MGLTEGVIGTIRRWNDIDTRGGGKLFVVIDYKGNHMYDARNSDGVVGTYRWQYIEDNSHKFVRFEPDDARLMGKGIPPLLLGDLRVLGHDKPDAILDIDEYGARYFLFDGDVDGNVSEELLLKHNKNASFQWDNYADYMPEHSFYIKGVIMKFENARSRSRPVEYTAGGYAERLDGDSLHKAFLRGKRYKVGAVTSKYIYVMGEHGKEYEYHIKTKAFKPVESGGSKAGINSAIQGAVAHTLIHDEVVLTTGEANMKYSIEKVLPELKAAREVRLKAVQALDNDLDARVLNAFNTLKTEGKETAILTKAPGAEEKCVVEYDKVIKQLELLHEDFVDAPAINVMQLITDAANVDGFVKKYYITR